MRDVIVIAHNIRSTHNVGSIFRTCEGFGVKKLILSGYTPYPVIENDPRLPHIAQKITGQIHKTALDAETLVPFEHVDELDIDAVKSAGYQIFALEQHPNSVPLLDAQLPDAVALLLGEEVEGINATHLQKADTIIEIPMSGRKESFNVSVAAGIALHIITSK
jgi:tRNA G18 (ribose-2'-O)-methylase SpoU